MAYESELKTIEQLVESNIRGLASVEKIDFYPDLDTPQLSHLVSPEKRIQSYSLNFAKKIQKQPNRNHSKRSIGTILLYGSLILL